MTDAPSSQKSPQKPRQQSPLAPDAPTLWVLGGFGMTGSLLAQHAAECVAGADGTVLTLSFHPGAFAESDVSAAAARGLEGRPAGIIYLRSLSRLTGGGLGRGLALWMARFRALRRLIGQSGQVVLLREPGRAGGRQRAIESVLRLLLAARRPGRGGRARVLTLSAAVRPAVILRRHLRLPANPVAPGTAEERVFHHIRAQTAAELRLTDAHVERALAGPRGADLRPEVRADLLMLARRARRIAERDVDTALRQARIHSGPGLSRALDAARAPGPGGLPAIATHLRSLGKSRRHWRRWVPPQTQAQWTGAGMEAVVLRLLSDGTLPADAPALAELERPALGPDGGPLTRLDWFLMLALRLPVESPVTLVAPWESPALARNLASHRPPRRPARGAARAVPELRLTGIAGNGTGLAQNFWMSARALEGAGLAPRLCPVDAAPGTLSALPPAGAPVPARARLRRDVTLLHLNADRVPQAILDHHRDAASVHIGFLLWELDRLPDAHRLALRMLDEIWVPSTFLRDLYAPQFDGHVALVRKGIALPAPAPWPGPAAGVTRFVICFDQRSSVARKNPLAAVRAFGAAFSARRDVELIVKVTPGATGPWGDPEGQMAAIRAAAARDARIRIVERNLPFATLLGLIASADCLVSPHRAEGFGYMPAFALMLGVPVIATDHSGTRDFCTPETSDPVPARLVRVPRGHAILSTPGARWAEVDIDALGARMASVVDDPGPARARAQHGRRRMEQEYSMAALSERYRARLAAMGLLLPEENGTREDVARVPPPRPIAGESGLHLRPGGTGAPGHAEALCAGP